MRIRPAGLEDRDRLWSMLEPVIRAGETYALPTDMGREAALSYWTGADRETFVALEGEAAVGTYYMRANQAGGGSHVANCGYVTAAGARGRGVARRMCLDSLDRARERGFRAMQFNFVVESNEPAVRLWRSLGFEVAGRLPDAFRRPDGSYSDALVMFRRL